MLEALIIFVRNPELGKVKTRLAATMGDERALDIYRSLLQHTCSITQSIAADKYVFYTSAPEPNDLWEKAGYHQLLQQEGNLGHKMQQAFETLLKMGYQKVVIIGSDCIDLTSAIIEEAFHCLSAVDAVIGPANDGGYYLLGIKNMYPRLFQNKEWSATEVYQTTINDFESSKLSYEILPQLIDIDTEDDWQQSQQDAK